MDDPDSRHSADEAGALTAAGPARPRSLVVAWTVGGLAALLLLVEAATPGAQAVGTGYVVYLLMAGVIETSCVLGLWFRKRWGVVGYGSFFPFHQIILATAGTWGPVGFVVRALVLGLVVRNLRHLR